MDDESGVPGYIAVSSACDRCFGEDSQFLPSFGVARIIGDGSDFSFSCDSLRAAMRMKALANEFTTTFELSQRSSRRHRHRPKTVRAI